MYKWFDHFFFHLFLNFLDSRGLFSLRISNSPSRILPKYVGSKARWSPWLFIILYLLYDLVPHSTIGLLYVRFILIYLYGWGFLYLYLRYTTFSVPAFRDVIDIPLVVRRLHKSRAEVCLVGLCQVIRICNNFSESLPLISFLSRLGKNLGLGMMWRFLYLILEAR